ncbi:CRISPR-associated RAMP protein [Candidatus Scalindua japonica]|uniref:CRISPR system Cms protein Csm2 n=1 Tax=Candidatus Scalindua japonica TaxID=1284222 RepID=A0A286U1Y5_9BACT|nr:type III-A CRISPR-associated protein Csm2 [Candidatus Scalindua japonica]GAX62163.1 CRISPR-associated RAMP protein [Candidatus Scalindua japonica]
MKNQNKAQKWGEIQYKGEKRKPTASGGIEEKLNKIKKLSEFELESLIDFAECCAQDHLRRIETHQIRRFFNAVKNIKLCVDKQNEFTDVEKAKLLMLRPQLANASAKKRDLREFSSICTSMIKKVTDKDDFYQFAMFFESVVAFHKAST